MKKLNNAQQVIYEYLAKYQDENGYLPSVREICKAVGLSSTSTVHMHLKKLEECGRIQRDGSKNRAITLVRGNPDATQEDENSFRRVPLVGRVAAGMPVLAVENIEDAFPLPDLLLHGCQPDEVFMLRVEGESMINAAINPGDIIIVNKALNCENGDIVVARIDDDTVTVKRLFRENDCVRLQPENDLFEPN